MASELLNDYILSPAGMLSAGFWISSVFTAVCASAAVFVSDTRRSVLFFCASMAGLTILYGLINSLFLAEVQLLLFVGAVSLMLASAACLTKDTPQISPSESKSSAWINGTAAILMFIMLGIFLKSSSYFQDYKIYTVSESSHMGYYTENVSRSEDVNSLESLSKRTFKPYFLTADLCAVLIFLSILGINSIRSRNVKPLSFKEIAAFCADTEKKSSDKADKELKSSEAEQRTEAETDSQAKQEPASAESKKESTEN